MADRESDSQQFDSGGNRVTVMQPANSRQRNDLARAGRRRRRSSTARSDRRGDHSPTLQPIRRLAPRWEWIVTVAISFTYFAVLTVYEHLNSITPSGRGGLFNCFCLGLVV